MIVGFVLAAPAQAEDARTQARGHFEAGRKLYQVGEYGAALTEFQRAFLLKEDPVFIYNIAQCHRQLGDGRQAITFYKRYLGTNPPAANRQQVQKLIADLERAQSSEPAPVPSPPPVRLAAPEPPPPAPSAIVASAPPPSPPDQPIYGRWWFWTGVAAVVAGGVATALLVGRDTTAPGCSRGVDYCAGLPR
jgi:tetratricopeptide (TPR) repeat protein